ncbi:hypothetical protein I6N91_07630 [Arthrobacter sp. MSA 4-2]|uniref:hypothetical protein n=1 Tax=Arthrobacter sp. MSA 4-2 TaxID=2794349 RepID=UPI0018E89F36|nr:hypothetical protein [Arthrobacter sp. MSA 4-2]MBJ2120848.1 hypothetical protein [Arthrobacter sp. MSA 4-2]
MKNSIALTAALLLGIGLSACNGAEPTESPGGVPSATQDAIGEAPASQSAAFGDTVTFEGDVEVTVESRGFQSASGSAPGAVEGRYAVFEITVVNNGQEEVDGGLMNLPTVRAGDAGTAVQPVVDSDTGIGGELLSTIPPGDTQTAQFAYGIAAADADIIQMEIADPTGTGEDAIYQGAIE